MVNKNILSSFVPSSLDHNDEEENLEKSCVITAFSPVEDFNKLLENGIDPEIGGCYFVRLKIFILTFNIFNIIHVKIDYILLCRES